MTAIDSRPFWEDYPVRPFEDLPKALREALYTQICDAKKRVLARGSDPKNCTLCIQHTNVPLEAQMPVGGHVSFVDGMRVVFMCPEN